MLDLDQRAHLRRRKGVILRGVTVLLAAACAAAPAAEAPGPVLDARVERLAAELRCLVCDNQTIADSNAQLARDLKARVREQLAAGRSEEQVIAFLAERYGDFVLYRPPVKASTWPLWFGPFALLGFGLWWLWKTLARQQREAGLARKGAK